jgi:DNA replication and repair protein RecF
MLLQTIDLLNFRNIEKSSYDFNHLLTVIIGENAKGKTNLLESIFTLINGEGFRESKEEELILMSYNQATINGVFIEDDDKLSFKIIIQKKLAIVEKHYFINKTKKRLNQYLNEQIKAVLFTPEQIDLIIGTPGIRRDYFNKLISYYDFEYKKHVDNYDNALRRRNKVLENHYSDRELVDELQFWNDYLIKQAKYISNKREEYCFYLNNHPDLDSKSFSIEYLKNEFNEVRMKQVFEEEKRMRRTVIGPQKDDFQISMKGDVFPPAGGKNIHHYGSRSEQRMAVFWLKMNEINYYEDIKHKKPILLLDDVFSELDNHNKKIVLDLIKKYQTVLTTTEEEILKIVKVENTVIRL